jgi:hypothetical protein
MGQRLERGTRLLPVEPRPLVQRKKHDERILAAAAAAKTNAWNNSI